MATGAFIVEGPNLQQAIGWVRLCEELGYESVWATHVAARDPLLLLTAYAHATSRVRLGTGIVGVMPHHPVSVAQQAATLDEITQGRLVLGIGPSHQPYVGTRYGMRLDRPLTRMREYVAILRSIFATGGVDFQGEFYSAQFSFVGYSVRPDLPIYLSALSPRMLELGGEVADGVVLWLCTPEYVREVAVPHVRAGAERAGRTPESVAIVDGVFACATSNPQAALSVMANDLVHYVQLPFYRAMLTRAGFSTALQAFDAAIGAGHEEAVVNALVPIARAVAAVGSSGAIRERIEEYRQAGVSLPCVRPFRGDEGSATLEDTLRAGAPVL